MLDVYYSSTSFFFGNMSQLLVAGLNITVLGCNDFYSYRNQVNFLNCISILITHVYFSFLQSSTTPKNPIPLVKKREI